MIPVWAMVLLVVFVPGIIKLMLDGMSGGQRGGSFMGMKTNTIVMGVAAVLLIWFVFSRMSMY